MHDATPPQDRMTGAGAAAPAAAPPSVVSAPGRQKERFIAVSRFALLKRLSRKDICAGRDSGKWKLFLHYLAAWRHQEHRDHLLRLKERYLPFSPDRDTVRVLQYTEKELDQIRHEFVEEIGALVERANYRRLDQADIDRLLSTNSPYGLTLHVDLSELDNVLLYCRGLKNSTHSYRDPNWLYLRKRSVEQVVFQRFFVLVKLKPERRRIKDLVEAEGIDEYQARKRVRRMRAHLPKAASSDHIYLKLFKQLPQDDIEMLFPNIKVQFKLLDKVKLAATAGGGTLASIAATVTKVAAATNPIALAAALSGLIGVVARQVMSFFNTRNRYMMVLAQNLFFHNLANNRGVLTLLVDRAEEEDIKEDMLLYYFLTQAGSGPRDSAEVRAEIEAFLFEQFRLDVAFDIDDAAGRLIRDGLVHRDPQGRLIAVDTEEACANLENRWRSCLKDGLESAKETTDEEL